MPRGAHYEAKKVGYMDLSVVKDEYVQFYGLYNVETESGLSINQKGEAMTSGARTFP